MITVIAPNGVEPVPTSKPLGGGRNEVLRLLPKLDLGQILDVRVGAKLADGSFIVEIADQAVKIPLPAYVATGDRIKLTLVSIEPQLTFALNEVRPQINKSAPPLPQTTTTPLATTPQATAPLSTSPQQNQRADNSIATQLNLPVAQTAQPNLADARNLPQLSQTGRFVASMMPPPGKPATLTTSTTPPLIIGPAPNTVELAHTLQQTLGESGLFYESHQAEWVEGKRELMQLKREPQAKLHTASAPSTASATPPSTRPLASQVEDMLKPASDGTISLSNATQVEKNQLPSSSQTTPIVQQQLAALESGKIVIPVEVWHQQWMQWEIEDQARDTGRDSYPSDQPGENWHTKLTLDLPNLGAITADLSMLNHSLQIKLFAQQAETIEAFQAHKSALFSACTDAGMQPADISITGHE